MIKLSAYMYIRICIKIDGCTCTVATAVFDVNKAVHTCKYISSFQDWFQIRNLLAMCACKTCHVYSISRYTFFAYRLNLSIETGFGI